MAIAIVLFIYGAITAAGGVMGYVEAKNAASLAAGLVCGSTLIASGILLLSGFTWASYLAFAVNVLLIVILWQRYSKTKSMMPAGMMLGISVVVAGVLFTEIFQ